MIDVEVTPGRTIPVKVELTAGSLTVTATDTVAIDPTSNRIQTNITAQAAERGTEAADDLPLHTTKPSPVNVRS